jgi:hypothetical protein
MDKAFSAIRPLRAGVPKKPDPSLLQAVSPIAWRAAFGHVRIWAIEFSRRMRVGVKRF